MEKAIEKKKEMKLMLGASDEVIDQLDFYAKQGGLVGGVESTFRQIFMTSAVVYNLQQLLTPKVMEQVMWLQNNPIGFLTDQKGAGYPLEVVKNAIINATMEGVNVIGNEFNIIAGRCYITKNGMKKKLRNIPGLRYHATPAIPRISADKGAYASVHLDWTYNGERHEQDVEFAIRVNAGMGADAIVGKATRKALAWLYEEVTGNEVSEGDVYDAVPIVEEKKESPIEAETATKKAVVMQEQELAM